MKSALLLLNVVVLSAISACVTEPAPTLPKPKPATTRVETGGSGGVASPSVRADDSLSDDDRFEKFLFEYAERLQKQKNELTPIERAEAREMFEHEGYYRRRN